jgi:hypothetical protein
VFIEHNPDNLPDGLSEPVRAEAVALIKERDTPGAPDFTRAEHMAFGHYGLSKEIQIEANGEVVVYQDGGQRRITRRSAYNRKIRLLLESNPPGQPRPKIRTVKTAFMKARRRPTEAELQALARANAARHLEAKLRRQAEEVKTPSEI